MRIGPIDILATSHAYTRETFAIGFGQRQTIGHELDLATGEHVESPMATHRTVFVHCGTLLLSVSLA